MKYLLSILILFLLATPDGISQKTIRANAVIFDSDMGPDYDDVGAIAMLHAFADSGYIRILATIASTKYEGVAGVFDVLNTYFNRPEIPVGVPRREALDLRDFQHWSDTLLERYPHKIKSNSDAMDATELYRKVLASQPDHSVQIITVGFFTNLSYLLQSPADKYSNLTGVELVRKKVKRLVSMAGKFPSGKEFNVEKDAKASIYVFENWPTQILLSGFEIGAKIKVGVPLMNNTSVTNSPVKDVFRISIPKAKSDSAGRMSWDETAVMVAVKGHERFYSTVRGRMIVASDGSNSWSPEGNTHEYLVERSSPEIVQQFIEKLIAHQPVRRKP